MPLHLLEGNECPAAMLTTSNESSLQRCPSIAGNGSGSHGFKTIMVPSLHFSIPLFWDTVGLDSDKDDERGAVRVEDVMTSKARKTSGTFSSVHLVEPAAQDLLRRNDRCVELSPLTRHRSIERFHSTRVKTRPNVRVDAFRLISVPQTCGFVGSDWFLCPCGCLSA